MRRLHLVDTSCWIELLRSSGRANVKKRLGELLVGREAAWSDIIRLELWNGASEDDTAKLFALEKFVACLETDEEVWRISHELARLCRGRGWTFPAADVLIVACAARHRVSVESRDTHFESLIDLVSSCAPPRFP